MVGKPFSMRGPLYNHQPPFFKTVYHVGIYWVISPYSWWLNQTHFKTMHSSNWIPFPPGFNFKKNETYLKPPPSYPYTQQINMNNPKEILMRSTGYPLVVLLLLLLVGKATEFFSQRDLDVSPPGIAVSTCYFLAKHELSIWMFPKIVGFPPKSSILTGFFMKKTINFLGYHYFWKHLFTSKTHDCHQISVDHLTSNESTHNEHFQSP